MQARNLKILFMVFCMMFLVAQVGYTQDPPTHLTTNGNFDDHINLDWWPPGMTGSELTMSIYEGAMANAQAHWNGGDAWAITIDPNAIGNYELWAISIYILSEGDLYWPWPNAIHEPVIIKAWSDNAGVPGTEIYSMQDQHSGVGSWLVHPVTGVTASGVIYVGNEQMDAYTNCEGMGVDPILNFGTMNWYCIGGVWSQALDISGDLMFEALVYGDFGDGPEARWVGPSSSPAAEFSAPSTGKEAPKVATLHQGSLPPFWSQFHTFQAPSYSKITRNSGATDDLVSYNIYRDGSLYGSTVGLEESYDDYGVVEGTQYVYTVSALYVPEGESIQTDPAPGTANMPPGPPTNLAAVSNMMDSMTLTWDDPIVNDDGTPCVDLAGLMIYRDAAFLAQVNPGVQTYVDVPPDPMTRYTWSVTGVDEVPNEGDAAQVTGAVISPWQQIPYEWVEISGIGVNTGIVSDDQNVGPFAFGFNFEFYGNIFNSIRVCSNGFLSFTSTSTTWTNAAIPTATEPNNLIAPFWEDLNPSSAGTVWYLQDTPNERFIVQYQGVAYYSGGGNVTIQVVFNADGSMIYAYNSIGGINTSCTVGVENATGTMGEQVCYNGTGDFLPTSGTAIGWWMSVGPAPDVSVVLTPVGLPIQLPASGGTFGFNVAIANNETTAEIFDVWTNVSLPGGGSYGPIINVNNFNAPGLWTGNRDRTQAVPDYAPAGMYAYNAYVGVYPGQVWSEDSFPFEKLPVGDGAVVSGWATSGDSFDEWLTDIPAEIPANFAIVGVYPNPFNPTTTFSYQLPEAAHVSLAVYDLSGRLVANLVDGLRTAGSHDVTFDGSGLASGVYIYHLEAGTYQANGKMVMMK
ncbi:T9SS type A sorting domain-containing protein [bacterium]|nr:T9SS type A sorting domain-containing protein [bacterium]